MQGQRSSVSTLPENLSFDHVPASSDTGITSQLPWNNMQNSAEAPNAPYLHHIGLGEWSLGEPSSRAAINLEERPLESSNILSLDNGTMNRSSPIHILEPDSGPHDLNMRSEFGDGEDDDCQVIEHPHRHIPLGSSNEKRPATGVMEDSDYRRVSHKRKALEVQIGHSSEAGSSSSFEHAERNQWRAVTSAQISASNVSLPPPAANNLVFSNGSEQVNPRIHLGVRGAVSSNPLPLNARGTAESSQRNLRMRISGSHQMPENPFSTEANVGNSDVSSSRYALRLARNTSLFELTPVPPVENGSHLAQPVLPHVPPLRRNPHSRWSGASTSRTRRSSSAETGPLLYQEPPSGNIPGNVFGYPMLVPASERGSSSQQPTNWNLARGGSTSRVNSPSPSPFWSHRNHPLYPRRLSEMVRRTLLSAAGTEPGGQSSSSAIRSQETLVSSGSGNQGPQSSNMRSALLERHLDGAFGIPYSLRSLASAGEGRSNIMSEIRHVLDLMRRGEGLRFEDMMMLDHSVFLGMAEMHDRHRDMRLDIDNMSYEELLALEDRIGNVCTGLNEETITSRLKQHKYGGRRSDEAETEQCSICREEYNEGEDVGRLECGHDFHGDCIKQWLLLKNLCPICKTTGLST